jgi:hypothetical protein
VGWLNNMREWFAKEDNNPESEERGRIDAKQRQLIKRRQAEIRAAVHALEDELTVVGRERQ